MSVPLPDLALVGQWEQNSRRMSRRRFSRSLAAASAIAFAAIPAWAAKPIGISARTQDAVRDSDGTTHLIWTEGTLGNAVVHTGILDLATAKVTGDEQVGSGVDAAFGRPLLALGPGGTLHAVWTENEALIRHAARSSAGMWTLETVLAEGDPVRYAQPSLAVRADGSLHVVAQQWGDPTAGEHVFYVWRTAGGTWSSPVSISVTTGARDVSLLRDAADGLHVRYTKGYRYAAAPSLLDEAAHQAMPKHADSKDGPFFGDIFVSSDSMVHLAFSDCVAPCGADGPLAENYTSIPVGGTTFSPPEHASSAPFTSADAWPAIGVDSDGRAYVIWCSSAPGSPSCKLAVREPGTSSWVETTLDTDAGMSRSTQPTLVVTPDAVYGLWRHGDGGIWLETLSPPLAGADAGSDAAPAPGDAGADAAVPDASGSTSPGESEGGCGCRTQRRGTSRALAALVVLSLALAALRRRRPGGSRRFTAFQASSGRESRASGSAAPPAPTLLPAAGRRSKTACRFASLPWGNATPKPTAARRWRARYCHQAVERADGAHGLPLVLRVGRARDDALDRGRDGGAQEGSGR